MSRCMVIPSLEVLALLELIFTFLPTPFSQEDKQQMGEHGSVFSIKIGTYQSMASALIDHKAVSPENKLSAIHYEME